MKIAVVGGGAAGLMAAGEAAAAGAEVTLFEKNEKLGRKLAITGKGRCNVTNLCGVGEFLSNVATNPKFLYSALNCFTPQNCVDFFERLGVGLKTERGKRVFPKSGSAFDIVDALKKYIKTNGVKIKRGAVEKLLICGGRIAGVAAGGQTYDFERVILCTGGASYPGTGSTGDGYGLAARAGHGIADLKPSLVPLETGENFCAELMGLSLKNITMRLYEGDKKIFEEMGEMLFTHFGISGPLALSASSHIRDAKNKSYTIKLDLKPALGAEQLDKRILSDFEKYKNKMFKNSLDDLLPKKMIPVFVKILEDRINPEKKINEITKAERTKLAGLFKDFTMSFKAFRPIDEAIITCGGVKTDEIHSNTMESKLVAGLYFAGEIIDVDAYTGGFNLQIAFSTGKLAGKSAAEN
ncbi:MAG: NAD(P)/FAD-dependent oxidoreductase [Oscillospiraceae bacterium]|nr:NAD(P)/FAD-dependent oxidoreductase [Oscillospiraceae bacterium]